MSPNRLELETALDELRSELPPPAVRDRSFDALAAHRPNALRLPVLAVASALVLGGLLLAPQRGTGLAWAAVLRATRDSSHLHIVTLDSKGKGIGEYWKSGEMWASYGKDQRGRIEWETRTDDDHFYMFLRRDNLTAPNATQYATLYNVTPQMIDGRKGLPGPFQSIQDLLTRGKASLLRQLRTTVQGQDVERFLVSRYGEEQSIDADSKSGRILALRNKDGSVLHFEYPSAIEKSVFDYRSRLSKDVYLLDLRGKENPRTLPPYLPKPIASKKGIQLREVSLTMEGDLFVLWTGNTPRQNAAKRPEVKGTRVGKTLWLGPYKNGVPGRKPSGLICYRAQLPQKVGKTLTFRIPTRKGYAAFVDIPIKRP